MRLVLVFSLRLHFLLEGDDIKLKKDYYIDKSKDSSNSLI